MQKERCRFLCVCNEKQLFAYVISRIQNTNRQKKNTGQCFSIELQFTCKTSDKSEKNLKTA